MSVQPHESENTIRPWKIYLLIVFLIVEVIVFGVDLVDFWRSPSLKEFFSLLFFGGMALQIGGWLMVRIVPVVTGTVLLVVGIIGSTTLSAMNAPQYQRDSRIVLAVMAWLMLPMALMLWIGVRRHQTNGEEKRL